MTHCGNVMVVTSRPPVRERSLQSPSTDRGSVLQLDRQRTPCRMSKPEAWLSGLALPCIPCRDSGRVRDLSHPRSAQPDQAVVGGLITSSGRRFSPADSTICRFPAQRPSCFCEGRAQSRLGVSPSRPLAICKARFGLRSPARLMSQTGAHDSFLISKR